MKVYKTDAIFEIVLKIAKTIMYISLTVCSCDITATYCKPADPELIMLEKDKIRMEIRSYELAEREMYDLDYSEEVVK